jgi:hypothetical protein
MCSYENNFVAWKTCPKRERSEMKRMCYEDREQMRSKGEKRADSDKRVVEDENLLSNIGCLIIREEIVKKDSAVGRG